MEETLYIRDFGDAVGAAMGIKDRFGRAHGAALLDGDGLVLDMIVFTDRAHSIANAIAYVALTAPFMDELRSVVLFSALRRDVRTIREEDVETFERAKRELGSIRVLDWIQCNRKDIRSLAFTIGASSREHAEA